MLNSSQIKLFSILYFVLTALTIGACNKNTPPNPTNPETIRIGEVETLTGSEANYGVAIHRGALLAIDQLNDRGGVNGKKIELITLDDQGKSEEAAIAATKLITQHKVQAIIGAVTSSRSLAIAPIANRYKVPMISPTATNRNVTKIGKGIFRTCFIDEFQGAVMAKFALEHVNVKTAAIIRDIKSDYSIGLSDVFVSVFTKGGGQIVMEQSFSSGDIDFKSQLTAIRAKNPQVLFIPAYYSDAALILRQARDLGIQAPILGTDGFDSPKLIEIAGAAADNAYFSSHFSVENKSTKVQQFISNFKNTHGLQPDGIAALGYDTAGILIDAFQRSQAFDSTSLMNAIAATENYEGVTGKITIDSDRNPIKSATIMKLSHEKVIYQTMVNP